MKNKDLPCFPVMPFKNQFGQDVILSGYSKQEYLAMKLFLARLESIDSGKVTMETMIEMCFEDAEKFCSHGEEEKTESKIVSI